MKAASVAVSASITSDSAHAAGIVVCGGGDAETVGICASLETVAARPVAIAVPALSKNPRRGSVSSDMTFSLSFFAFLMRGVTLQQITNANFR
jgi:hypothetical protein